MRNRLLLVLAAASLVVGALAAKDGREELESATRRTSQLDSYSFVTSYQLKGIPLLQASYEVRGAWQRGIAHFIFGPAGREVEVYRMNGRRVIRKHGGGWESAPSKGRDSPEGGRGQRTPHEDFEALSSEVRAVSRSDGFEMVNSKRCVAYEAELTAEGTRDLIPVVGVPIDTSDGGRARIWVNEEGIIQKYSMVGDVKATILGMRLPIRATNTTELNDIGKTGAKPPDEVMRLLNVGK